MVVDRDQHDRHRCRWHHSLHSDVSSLDDIAAAALWNLRAVPIEHMGALYAQGDGYARSGTVSGNGGKVRGQIEIPTGSLRGLFHNHPGTNAEAVKFSPDDKARARKMGVPSYITVPDGRVFKFDPRNNETTEVLAEFPIDEVLAALRTKWGT